jgi:chitinase
MCYSALPQRPSHVRWRARLASAHVSSLFSRWLRLSVSGLFVPFLASNVFAGSVTLAWDAVPASDVAGHILYYGYRSGIYTVSVDVGTSTTAMLSGLDEGETYYFAATAYDVDGYESSFSNEVSFTIPGADTTPPTVTIMSPADGTPVQRKSTVTIKATATDAVGVTKVEFYVNDSLKCTDVTGPYACTWKVPASGGHTYRLQAETYDTSGNVGSSNIVRVQSY